MEDTIQKYKAAVEKTKIMKATKYAFAITGAAAGAGAVAVPPLAAVGAFAGLGAFVLSEREKKELPKDVKVAAMFYDARRRFGWYNRKR